MHCVDDFDLAGFTEVAARFALDAMPGKQMAIDGELRSGTIDAEAARRRTFAIISHPDAGKTTLTEKLLLFGGAIQLAGH